MKKTILLCLVLSFYQISSAQEEGFQFFDGADTVGTPFINFQFETDSTNVWMVGPPQKTVFNEAFSSPNVLITDTLAPYPANANSSVGFGISSEQFGGFYGILALRWAQQLDMETGSDFGTIEFSMDSIEWQSAFDNPFVYSFYGYEEQNVQNMDGEFGFTGTDTLWRDIWLCYDLSYLWEYDSLYVRYRFVSDSLTNNSVVQNNGWMMDNFMYYLTWVHTLAEEEMSEYMRVYPTQTNGRVFIETQKLPDYHIINSIHVFDTQGKLVREYGRAPVKFFIDLDDLQNGQYIIQVQTNLKTNSFPIFLEK